jgi:hypothetical protein
VHSEGVVHEGTAYLHFLLADVVPNEATLHDILADQSQTPEESLLENLKADHFLPLIHRHHLSRRKLHNCANFLLSPVLHFREKSSIFKIGNIYFEYGSPFNSNNVGDFNFNFIEIEIFDGI